MRITPELLSRHDRPGPRYTSYPTAVEFHEGFAEKEYIQRLQQAASSEEPLSIYVHLPFCEKRCLYCACNVVIDPAHRIGAPYMEHLLKEIDLVVEHLGRNRRVTQLHFGGGTPTYYSPEDLRRLTQHLRERFQIDPDAEIAIELDPRVTTDEHLVMLVEEGFNRFSLGVQDLDAKVQEVIHRIQPLEMTAKMIQRLRDLGITSINVDLIYGLPHQNLTSFKKTLDQIAALRPERLAVYSFAYVPWIVGHQKKLADEPMPTGHEKLQLFSLASEVFLDAGYVNIGMDHFALPEDTLCIAQREGRLSRNFMGYTTARAPEMIGFGQSAIGYVSNAYVQNIKKFKHYIEAIAAGHLPVERGNALNDDDLVRAHIIRELMCNFIVKKAEVNHLFNLSFDEKFKDLEESLQTLADDGFITLNDEEIKATELGQIFIRNVGMVFDAYLGKKRTKPTFSRTV